MKLLGEMLGAERMRINPEELAKRLPSQNPRVIEIIAALSSWKPQLAKLNLSTVQKLQEIFPMFSGDVEILYQGRSDWNRRWCVICNPAYILKRELEQNESWKITRKQIPTPMNLLWRRIWPLMHDACFYAFKGFQEEDETDKLDETLEPSWAHGGLRGVLVQRDSRLCCLFELLANTIYDCICASLMEEDEVAIKLRALINCYLNGHFLLGMAFPSSPMIITLSK